MSSNNEIAIRVTGIGKRYHIYDRPQDRLKQSIMPYLRHLVGRQARNYFRDFWALQDISFDLRKGETMGIIGRNGSGKSTLLQIICGTLFPTVGEVEVNGRVAALLELGAGFNPEFTGRENVYMNGTLMGLTGKEIDERFDRIAAFADIGEFIEQPVKAYSSGMFVRLAFAIIAHVDADILVVDEALAVGDAVFTQKCMRYIRKFQENGALLFVSHDMGSIINLCQNAIWLGNGRICQSGPSKQVSEAYLQYTLQEICGEEAKLTSIPQDKPSKLAADEEYAPPPVLLAYEAQVSVRDNILDASGWRTGGAEIVSVHLDHIEPGVEGIFCGGERVRMSIHARAIQPLDQPILGFLVRDRLGQDLFGENTLPFTNLNPLPVSAGQSFFGEFIFRLPMLPNGQYAVMVSVANGDLCDNVQHHWLHDALIVNVSSSKVRYGLVGVSFEQVSLKCN